MALGSHCLEVACRVGLNQFLLTGSVAYLPKFSRPKTGIKSRRTPPSPPSPPSSNIAAVAAPATTAAPAPMHSDILFPKHLAEGEDEFFRHHDQPQPPIPEQFPNLPSNGDPVYPAYNEIKSQLRRIRTHQKWITKIVPQYEPHVSFPDIKHIFDIDAV